MAEWSIAAVLKTVEVRASGGSNPSLSANMQSKKKQNAVSQHLQRFLFYKLKHQNARKSMFPVAFLVD